MASTGIFTPHELAVMSKVLDDHCAERGIERSSADHVDAGYLVLSLFNNQSVKELKAALDAALAGEERRQA